MTTLCSEVQKIPCAPLEPESCLPDIREGFQVQNRTRFDLGEEDEIYQGYGQRQTAYPYRQQSCYGRRLIPTDVTVIRLENEYIKAEFLPDYGGRLWSLYDKVHQRSLVYQNDCIRASNLAVRNAWFSGGVEWNCGVIGHTPYTMSPIFASRGEQDGIPFLRMYAFERIRSVCYQMDFWLEDSAPVLNAHMSIYNTSDETIPMYWWSNIAMPLYPQGRIFVPAYRAYTSCAPGTDAITKVPIPYPETGVDVSRYETIPTQRDYFFELDQGAPRWILHADKEGGGLLHTSTDRLQSRKLFVWSTNDGGNHWQEFLTEGAGPYLEIQAGLGKTQYGCLPMSPQTTWQWTERYQPAELSPRQMTGDFFAVSEQVSQLVRADRTRDRAEQFGRTIQKLPTSLMHTGSGDAALENALRSRLDISLLPQHLAYTSDDIRTAPWIEYLHTGHLPASPPGAFPAYDIAGTLWLHYLKAHLQPGNWYYFYCLSLLEYDSGRPDLADQALAASLALQKTAVGYYTAAVYALDQGEREAAVQHISAGLALCGERLSYIKEALKILQTAEAWTSMLTYIDRLSAPLSADGRISFYRALALCETGRPQEALEILEQNGGLIISDLRECEVSIGHLWRRIQVALYGSVGPVPHRFNFDSL